MPVSEKIRHASSESSSPSLPPSALSFSRGGVRKGELLCLDACVEVVGAVEAHRRKVEAFEEVERLQRGQPLRVWGQLVHREPAVRACRETRVRGGREREHCESAATLVPPSATLPAALVTAALVAATLVVAALVAAAKAAAGPPQYILLGMFFPVCSSLHTHRSR